jgi:broad specificity polyphosphatase/5'/3'-nucleotidase SurE
MRVARLGERRFPVMGTSGDCAVMALRHLMRDAPPDLVLSGARAAPDRVEPLRGSTDRA